MRASKICDLCRTMSERDRDPEFEPISIESLEDPSKWSLDDEALTEARTRNTLNLGGLFIPLLIALLMALFLLFKSNV
jgi:hypothetical protein